MIRAALAFAFAAGPACAWTYGSIDNDAWFEAHVTSPDRTVSLHCGGVSPGGGQMPQTDEPMTTPGYTLMLTLAVPGLGQGGGARSDIAVASGTQGYVLPAAVWDEMDGSGWLQLVAVGDPLIAELRETEAIAIDSGGTRHVTLAGAGLGDALEKAIAFCDARWAATGRALPQSAEAAVFEIRALGLDTAPTEGMAPAGAAPARPTPGGEGTRGRAEAAIRETCEGDWTAEPGTFLSGDIDGDGAVDTAFFWDDVTCLGSPPRPLCGASQCAVEVFLSAAPGLPPGQATFYAQGVEMLPLSNGNMGLRSIGSLGMCRELGRETCEFIWYWDGTGLVQLPPQ